MCPGDFDAIARIGETIVIGENIRITIASIEGSQVQISTEAPEERFDGPGPNTAGNWNAIATGQQTCDGRVLSYKNGGRVGALRS